jgi:hypothetical protein
VPASSWGEKSTDVSMEDFRRIVEISTGSASGYSEREREAKYDWADRPPTRTGNSDVGSCPAPATAESPSLDRWCCGRRDLCERAAGAFRHGRGIHGIRAKLLRYPTSLCLPLSLLNSICFKTHNF